MSFTISRSLLKFVSVESVMLSNHLIPYCPLLLLPSVFPSIKVFGSESAVRIRWPKFWSFSFSISPSNKYSRLISFRIDWFYLLAVQGTLKSLLQLHSLKASILRHSAFFMVQLTSIHDYWKNHSFDYTDLCWPSPYYVSVLYIVVCICLEQAMAPHSSTLAWKIPWTEEPGRLQSMGSLRVRHDWVTSLSLSCTGEGNGNPLQCSCLENPRDGGAWWAAVYGVTQGQKRLKWLSSSSSSVYMLGGHCFTFFFR